MLFEGTCYLTPILGALLADSIWGRYKTILIFSGIYFLVRCHLIPLLPDVNLPLPLVVFAVLSLLCRPSTCIAWQMPNTDSSLVSLWAI